MLVAPPRCDDHWKYRVDDGKHLVTVIDIAFRAEAYDPGRA